MTEGRERIAWAWLFLVGSGGCVSSPSVAKPAGESPPPPVSSGAAHPVSGSEAVVLPASASGAPALVASATPPPGPPPLAASEPLVELEVEGHAAAVVSLPLGAIGPRPVLVATHGNYDHPRWTCAVWRDIVGDSGFVLCPRGVARGDSPTRDEPRYHYLTNHHLEREIEQGLRSLSEAYADYVGSPPHAYAGFSQGAIMGVAILGRRPELFDRVVLIEGGFDRWTPTSVKAYAASGGRRMLFVCGQAGCDRAATKATEWFDAVAVASRVVYAKGEGHTYGGAVAELLWQSWAWFVEGDARWSPSGGGLVGP